MFSPAGLVFPFSFRVKWTTQIWNIHLKSVTVNWHLESTISPPVYTQHQHHTNTTNHCIKHYTVSQPYTIFTVVGKTNVAMLSTQREQRSWSTEQWHREKTCHHTILFYRGKGQLYLPLEIHSLILHWPYPPWCSKHWLISLGPLHIVLLISRTGGGFLENTGEWARERTEEGWKVKRHKITDRKEEPWSNGKPMSLLWQTCDRGPE